MMEAIVAVYADWGIGLNGTQPVVVKADRKHFASVTAGAAVIVGRRTLEDFPGGRPLKNRTNIVMTGRDMEIEGAIVVHSVEEALAEAEKHDRVFVIGGESIYKQFYPHLDRVFVTKIDCIPHSDAFFTNLDEAPEWHVSDPGEELDQEGLKYRFMIYEK